MTESQTRYETDREKMHHLIKEVEGAYGQNILTDILLEGDDQVGAEPVSDTDARFIIEEYKYDNMEFGDVVDELAGHDEVVDSLESTLTGYYEPRPTERSRPGSLVHALRGACRSLPKPLAERLLDFEKTCAEGGMFDIPEDWETVLVIEQVAAEELGIDNEQERKDIWDELLKFSQYRVTITAEEGDMSRVVTRQSSSEAHNDVLRLFKHEYGDATLPSIDVTVIERYQPQFDPLKDLEDFVLYC